MSSQKPRILQDGRDMAFSMALVVLIAGIAVAFTGLCSYNPGKPENGPIPHVDANTIMGLEARAMPFPVRVPEDPEGWTTNSARRTTVDGHPATVQGWVTKSGTYIQLLQTEQPLDRALKSQDSEVKIHGDAAMIDGRSFETYKREGFTKRDLWGADLGDVRIVLAGTAPKEEFEQLAKSVLDTPPLPPEK